MVTVPIVTPLMMTEPSALITTGRFLPVEFKSGEPRLPNTNFTSRLLSEPLALPPDVAALSWHVLKDTLWPTASFEPAGKAGKLDGVTVNVQEPNFVVPVAVAPPALMENVGDSPVLVKANVVGTVVPKSGTPSAKVKGSFDIAPTVLAVTETRVLLVGVNVVMGADVSPPPHAAKTAEISTVKSNLLVLIMNSLLRKGGLLRPREKVKKRIQFIGKFLICKHLY